ncbi:MAG: hypothetical protein QXT58_01585 [Archaeoglobaceae archaeon]
MEEELARFFSAMFGERGWRFLRAGLQSFPDLVVEDAKSREALFGLEIKIKRTGKERQMPGNSIHSRPVRNLKFWQILLLSVEYAETMGREIQFRSAEVRLYFDAVTDIRITHSPRFLISFIGASLVEEILGCSVEQALRSGEKAALEKIESLFRDPKQLIRLAKSFFQKWIRDELREALAHIVDYDELEKEERQRLIARSIIFAPACIGRKRKTVVKEFFQESGLQPPTNLRDYFTAGGRVDGCPRVIRFLWQLRKLLVEEWVLILSGQKQTKALLYFWQKSGLVPSEWEQQIPIAKVLETWSSAVVDAFMKSYPNENPACVERLKCILEEIVREVSVRA